MASGTNNKKGFLSNVIEFFTFNPIFMALSGLLLLAFIMPARSRKYRRKNTTRRRRRKSGNPGKAGSRGRKTKVKKSKKTRPKKTKRIKSRKTSDLPAFMVKGSAAAKSHMAALRAMRKK
jgi:hypothetical protein